MKSNCVCGMRMNIVLVFLLYLPSVFSFSLGSLASSALDFVPIVGNLKSLSEAITGKDMLTGEELSEAERALSFFGAIPGGNYLKNAKHLKNGQKFLKAAQRAQKVGKMKNAINFAKAGARAMAKGNKVSNTVKNVFKAAKTFFKLGKEEINDNEDM